MLKFPPEGKLKKPFNCGTSCNVLFACHGRLPLLHVCISFVIVSKEVRGFYWVNTVSEIVVSTPLLLNRAVVLPLMMKCDNR